MKINIAYAGIRFQGHGEESASSQATRWSGPHDYERKIFTQRLSIFIHGQTRPQAVVHGIGHAHAVVHQTIAAVREHQ